MNAQQLKDSILQYAMQGKLVPQDPSDKPASELVSYISKEKERLIKEKVIKKETSIPQKSGTEVLFDIPQSWTWVKFGDVFNIVSSRRVKQADWRSEGIPFYRAREVGKLAEFGRVDNDLFIDEELYLKLSKSGRPKKNDLMLTAVGTLGKCYIVQENDIFYYKDASVISLENYAGLNPEFIKFFIESPIMKDQILGNSSGTTVSTLTISRMGRYILPLPPLEEQERVVQAIKILFDKVSTYGKSYNDLKDLQKRFPDSLENSILHYAVQGKIVEQNPNDEPAADLVKRIREEKERLIEEKIIKKENALPPINNEEIPFDIPENWEWVRLGDISSKIHYGYTASAQEKGNAKLLRITDIQKNQVIWENVPYCNVDKKKLDSIVLKERDILIARTGGTIGKSFLISDVKEVSVFASYLIRVQPLIEVNEIYLTYFLQSEIYWRQLKEMSAGTGQPNVNAQNLKKLLLPLPPLEEQARIIKEIRNFFDVTKKLVGTNSK